MLVFRGEPTNRRSIDRASLAAAGRARRQRARGLRGRGGRRPHHRRGPGRGAARALLPRERVVRPQHALLPGLVNAHTHACHTLLRGRPVTPARGRSSQPLGRARSARISCATAHGPRSPPCCAQASPASRTRSATGGERARRSRGPHARRDRSAGGRHRERLGRRRRRAPGARRSAVGRVPQRLHASRSTSRRAPALERCDTDRACAASPMSSRRASPCSCRARTGRRGGRRAASASRTQRRRHVPAGRCGACAQLGLLRPGCSVIGMLGCDAGELALARPPRRCRHRLPAGGAAPGRRARLRRLLPEVTAPALGSDSPAAAGACDLLAEARLAALLSGWSAAQALRWQRSAAPPPWACGRDRLHRARQGRRPHLHRSRGERRGPGTQRVAEAIVFAATRSQVSDVWTGGRAAVSGGRLLLLR